VTDLRVIVDGRALVGNPTGIGVHTAEIASRLGLTPAPLVCTHAPVADRQSLAGCRFRVDPSINGVWWQQVRLPAIACQERADVVWGPHTTLPLALDTPAVVSAHDLSSITMPGRHRLKTILSFNLFVGRSLENAAAIAAVSRHTAEELMRGFAIPSHKITIVPNGVDEFFCPAGPDEVDLPLEGVRGRDYLLFVGTLEPRKGIDDLLNAWRSLPRRPLLVLCGDRGWGRQAHSASDAASEIVLTGFVSRSQLRALYRHAFALVYPSRHEGFGLPPLEAMACGTPVITTRAGAIPEVVGDAALLVEPAAPDELAAAMASLISDQGRRRELSQRGIERASRFGWKRSAELMRELLMEAARGRRES
jgi:glycosyltransferase involved in cell wall biosynthesis